MILLKVNARKDNFLKIIYMFLMKLILIGRKDFLSMLLVVMRF